MWWNSLSTVVNLMYYVLYVSLISCFHSVFQHQTRHAHATVMVQSSLLSEYFKYLYCYSAVFRDAEIISKVHFASQIISLIEPSVLLPGLAALGHCNTRFNGFIFRFSGSGNRNFFLDADRGPIKLERVAHQHQASCKPQRVAFYRAHRSGPIELALMLR